MGETALIYEELESSKDVSDVAHDAGFKWPLHITSTAWDECVRWGDDDSAKQVFQSENVRLIDLLRVCAYTIRMADPEENKMNFEISRVPRDGESMDASRVNLHIQAFPGPEGKPALIIRDGTVQEHELKIQEAEKKAKKRESLGMTR